MSTLRSSRHDLRFLAAALAVTAVGAALVSACGTVEPQGARQPYDLAISSGDRIVDAGASTPCEATSPVTVGGADLADVAGLPADWPAPPVPALLCGTSGGAGSDSGSATYATPATPTTVLGQYEAALPATYEVTRQDGADGEMLTGRAGDVTFRLEAREGAYSLTFEPA